MPDKTNPPIPGSVLGYMDASKMTVRDAVFVQVFAKLIGRSNEFVSTTAIADDAMDITDVALERMARHHY